MEKDVNVVQADKKAAKYAGGFDSLDSGILAGWAADANSAEPLKFAIYCNGACIGSGVANLNRPDLKKAGFHEGLHGFKIEVNQELLIHDMPLQLRVFESDAVIPSNAFKVNLLVIFE